MDRIENLLRQAHGQVPSGHIVWDEYAVEVETAMLLFSLVQALKPALVVESGTGQGISGVFLAEALERNQQGGRLVTFEENDFFLEGAAKNLNGLPVEIRSGVSNGTDLRPGMVFIDCVSDLRDAEIRFWLTHPDQPLVVIHDARRSEYPFHLGDGVHIPGHDGIWIGRAKPQEN